MPRMGHYNLYGGLTPTLFRRSNSGGAKSILTTQEYYGYHTLLLHDGISCGRLAVGGEVLQC